MMVTSPMDALSFYLCFDTTSMAHRDAVRGRAASTPSPKIDGDRPWHRDAEGSARGLFHRPVGHYRRKRPRHRSDLHLMPSAPRIGAWHVAKARRTCRLPMHIPPT